MIPTFVINLKHRIERRRSIMLEFQNREREFDVTIVDAIEDPNGARGLWLSIQFIISKFTDNATEYVIICEDDHVFTDNYTYESLKRNINYATKLDADILLGGISWTRSVVKMKRGICWIEHFNGTQFTVIFRHMFRKILLSEFKEGDHSDIKLSNMSSSKYVIFPFISIQKDFECSDITPRNREKGGVIKLFRDCEFNMKTLLFRDAFYRRVSARLEVSSENVFIPAYICNTMNSAAIKRTVDFLRSQNEFRLNQVDILINIENSEALFGTLKEIVLMAINNDEDVIAVILNSLEPSEHYNTRLLINSIVLAHNCECDLIIGNIDFDFDYAIPVSDSLIWLHTSGTEVRSSSSNIFIIFKRFYNRIVAEFRHSSREYSSIHSFLSSISDNIMTIYPPIFLEERQILSNKYRLKNILEQHVIEK